MAINFQFGFSRALGVETSRWNVQMSVTSLTFCGSPERTVPALSRVAEMSWLTKRTVIVGYAVLQAGLEDIGLV